MDKEEILITIVTQIRNDVTDLSKSVSRNNAKVVSNGTKLDSVIDYNKKCDERLGDIEEWKAGHAGYSAGKNKSIGILHSKVTLYCTLAGILLGIAGFWFTIISPALTERTGVLDRLAAIEVKYQEASSPLK